MNHLIVEDEVPVQYYHRFHQTSFLSHLCDSIQFKSSPITLEVFEELLT